MYFLFEVYTWAKLLLLYNEPENDCGLASLRPSSLRINTYKIHDICLCYSVVIYPNFSWGLYKPNMLSSLFQAAMESLVSGAICGISYHLFSGQPLTIIGSTGPVLVFETIVYNFCRWSFCVLGFAFEDFEILLSLTVYQLTHFFKLN